MCWKYKNPGGTVFIQCDIANNNPLGASYLRVFIDEVEDYIENYNYCPYCGKKLEIKKKLNKEEE